VEGSDHDVGQAIDEKISIEEESLLVNLLLLGDCRVVKDIGNVAAVHIGFVGLDREPFSRIIYPRRWQPPRSA